MFVDAVIHPPVDENMTRRVFKPSPWPVLGSLVIMPLSVMIVLAFSLEKLHATMSILVFFTFFMGVVAKHPLTFLRLMNTTGAINCVTLTPEGIEHRGWHIFKRPFRCRYSWNDIHSFRAHRPSLHQRMIAFTPTQYRPGAFYRSVIDGSFGLPRYGAGEEMLEALIAFHRRYATNGMPSAG